MHEKESLGLPKAFMCCSNILFLMSGFVLMSLGALLLLDSERILLSRLLGSSDVYPEQPLFYYFALAIVGIGFVISIVGILGCWASCLHNCCITASYIMLLILLVIGECAGCVALVFWPHLLHLDVRQSRLMRALQRSYAVPGHEQFTAALDLAQTYLSCCGINGSSNYGTSWWRLQEVGRREFVVPLSCCALTNAHEPDGFLNPEPLNVTQCQALDPTEHQRARHLPACAGLLEDWTQEQILLLLLLGLCVILVELCALLSTILACTRLRSRKRHITNMHTSTFNSTQTLNPFNDPHLEYDICAGMGCGNGVNCNGLENRFTATVATNTPTTTTTTTSGTTFTGKS